ncbi:hypothetical protein [Parathalassolituus penaei]|uniref:Uncharacterized protein n=1 Tax=Parathalassolituus penaei TaxID=2997323 RepID=A0A9X3IQU5_9GAMM|nr:hypothetical protein [Parathalassolituus penaei]MCY0964537.1 hypothetical protein [Parathalassolituus penaei]
MKPNKERRIPARSIQIPEEVIVATVLFMEVFYLIFQLGPLLVFIMPVYALLFWIAPGIALIPIVIPILVVILVLRICGIRTRLTPKASKSLPPMKSQLKTLLAVIGLSIYLD